MTFDEDPIPKTKREGAMAAIVATDWAISAGPLVNAGTMAVPSLSSGV